MKTDALLKKILAEKEELIESCKLCTGSIDFWEERSNALFAEMDAIEEEFTLFGDKDIEDTCAQHFKEIDILMKRMRFENNQLDILENQIEKLEIKICLLLTEHAKKQKK